MCGIAGYWAKEANLSHDQWKILVEGAFSRGQDGIGIVVINKEGIVFDYKEEGFNKTTIDSASSFLYSRVKVGSIALLLCRATPETEKETTFSMLQPIINDDLYLVHNGGVTESIRDEIGEFPYTTDIDSEMILACYRKNSNNMKQCMEKLVGSFSFIMFDKRKNKLYAVTSFNPLAHMYIRGYGYFLHSDNDFLSKLLFSLTGQTQDGVNVWESWYHHYIDGYTIVETDIQSGFQFKQKYSPRFLHPTWGKTKTEVTKVLVVGSGGIDSSLTAFILSKLGYEITLVHFLYGQKSMTSELWAIEQMSKHLGCKNQIIDLRPFYSSLPEKGMLTSDDIDINSGSNFIKSTIAWSSGRNSIFASMAMAIGESMITSNQTDRIVISAGWYQLSEEVGGYPDNSFQFNNALESLKNYGYISGNNISFLPVMQRLTKTEEWVLGSKLLFPFRLTVSCDNPKFIDGLPHLCTECGSTKLSILASDRAGVPDPRIFLTDRPILSNRIKTPSIENIINRLVLPEKDKNKLKSFL